MAVTTHRFTDFRSGQCLRGTCLSLQVETKRGGGRAAGVPHAARRQDTPQHPEGEQWPHPQSGSLTSPLSPSKLLL